MDQETPLAELDALIEEIRTCFTATESVFLDIGRRLGEGIGTFRDVATSFEALPGELECPEVDTATRELERAVGQISHLGTALSEEEDILRRMHGMTVPLAGRIARLSKTMRTVKVLAVNAKVEAAHVAGQHDDLGIFTQEIGRLAGLAEQSLTSFLAEIDQLSEALCAALKSQKAFERSHADTLASVSQSVQASLCSVTDHRHQASNIAAFIGTTSAAVGERIGEVVSALQIGDITRQRVEHVAEALSLLRDVLSGVGDIVHGNRPSKPLMPAERDVLLASVFHLQARQMKSALEDFETEVGRIGTALRGIAASAREIIRAGEDCYGGGARRGRSFLAELEEELRRVDGMVEDYGRAMADAERVARSVAEGAERMVHHVSSVRSIEADMRVLGLNATLRCGRLGTSGQALAVVAQELRVCANQTVHEAAAVMAGLQDLVALAKDLDHDGREDRAREVEALAHEMAVPARRLGRVGQNLSASLEAMERDSERVAVLLEDTAERFLGAAELVGPLRVATAHMSSLAHGLPVEHVDEAEAKDLLLALMQQRYTMASERNIHILFAEPGETDAQPEDSVEADDGSLDSILF